MELNNALHSYMTSESFWAANGLSDVWINFRRWASRRGTPAKDIRGVFDLLENGYRREHPIAARLLIDAIREGAQ